LLTILASVRRMRAPTTETGDEAILAVFPRDIRCYTPERPPPGGSLRMLRMVVAALAFACASSVLAQQVKLTMWSHWAAEKIKRDFVEDAIKRFEAANPNVKIEATWYEKTAL